MSSSSLPFILYSTSSILRPRQADPDSALKEAKVKRTRITYSIIATVLVVFLLGGTAWWFIHERKKKRKHLAAHLKSEGWSLGRIVRRKTKGQVEGEGRTGPGEEERMVPVGRQFVWDPSLGRYETVNVEGRIGSGTAVILKDGANAATRVMVKDGRGDTNEDAVKGVGGLDKVQGGSLWSEVPVSGPKTGYSPDQSS
jgi:hypothetical protein